MGIDDHTLRHIEEQKTLRSIITACGVMVISVIGGITYYNVVTYHSPPSTTTKGQEQEIESRADARIENAFKVLCEAHTNKDHELSQVCAQYLIDAHKARMELSTSRNRCECVPRKRIARTPVDTDRNIE